MDRLAMKVFYFGCCRGESGHFWQVPNKPWHSQISFKPLGVIDAVYPPRLGEDSYYRKSEAPEGQAALVHVKGWTLIAYWDRSGDKRPNSNSAFAAAGEHTFEALLTAAKEQWPWVFERQTFEIALYPAQKEA